MKHTYSYQAGNKTIKREITYIPIRYIFAALFSLLETLAIIGIVFALSYYVKYFYIAALLTSVGCILSIVASDDNPEYKIPWLLVVLLLPIVGFMLYFLFYSRKLKKKYIRRLEEMQRVTYEAPTKTTFDRLKNETPVAHNQARLLCRLADTNLFDTTQTTYYPTGADMHAAILEDLKRATSFIYLEFFIVEEGVFWDSILAILKEKAKAGVDVRVLYDDIGCMATLPGNYAKRLAKDGIHATPYSRLKGHADSEFNNRNHRKILVIDGTVGYTGGVNIADEYIGVVEKYGHWKDVGLRLEGEAVWELTQLFLVDWGMNRKKAEIPTYPCFPKQEGHQNGYVIPFGDGPKPLYDRNVGKTVIQELISCATQYVYITTPYLIIDNDLCTTLENAALRGVDVKLVVPHIPDKKLVFAMTRSFYPRLMKAGVNIYEYTPGFIHAKCYLVDDLYAMVGTINLDYRSLVHHFENGVWMYATSCIPHIKADIEETLALSTQVPYKAPSPFLRFFRSIGRFFAPLL